MYRTLVIGIVSALAVMSSMPTANAITDALPDCGGTVAVLCYSEQCSSNGGACIRGDCIVYVGDLNDGNWVRPCTV